MSPNISYPYHYVCSRLQHVGTGLRVPVEIMRMRVEQQHKEGEIRETHKIAAFHFLKTQDARAA